MSKIDENATNEFLQAQDDTKAKITINSTKEGSNYSINTELSHENGLKVLVFVMELMDKEAKEWK